MSSLCFNTTFAALTDHQPLPWQVRLFNRFLEGDIPSACDLPTGLGKTAVIPIWLIALAETSSAPQLPRRLIYIVNRRTVVDQATDIAKQLYERLSTAEQLQDDAVRENLFRMRQALGRLCALSSDILVAISTLRGELADNQEWKTDPARPAMIIGTIDMIGSKLLFSGYGDGRYGRTHHAGLTGQDALIVLDEVHLTPAFAELLSSVAKEQQKLEGDRAIQVLELSATARRSDYNAITLTPEDESNEIVQTRLNAKKQLRFS